MELPKETFHPHPLTTRLPEGPAPKELHHPGRLEKSNMKLSHLKNIFVVSVGFLLIFVAFGGLQTLQSSLNPSGGLGAVSLSVTYGGQIFSAAVFTPFVISKLGCKLTLTIVTCFYIIYTLANFYPKWYTLMPASVILGLGASPFWTAKCTYLTVCARQYALKYDKKEMHVINQYFGIFFFVFQSSRIWGNLISSLVLNLAQPNDETIWNNTNCGSSEALLLTGNWSPISGNVNEQYGNWSQTSTSPSHPSKTLVYIILGVYVGVVQMQVTICGKDLGCKGVVLTQGEAGNGKAVTLGMNILKEFGNLLLNEPPEVTLKQWSLHTPQQSVVQQLINVAQAQEMASEGGTLGKVIVPTSAKLISPPGQTVLTLPVRACIPLEVVEIQIEPATTEQLPSGLLVA
ncbi:protein unc-93 homolog A-like [Ranitomeya imitator]|uniref:protein unc-93 homolog A-like n=1 Tax=Ranitomeya imitator TaxID=111125 RepID=UPI0037E819FE